MNPRALPPVTHGSAFQAPERLQDTGDVIALQAPECLRDTGDDSYFLSYIHYTSRTSYLELLDLNSGTISFIFFTMAISSKDLEIR